MGHLYDSVAFPQTARRATYAAEATQTRRLNHRTADLLVLLRPDSAWLLQRRQRAAPTDGLRGHVP